MKILIVKKRVSKKEATKFPNKLTRDISMKYSSRGIPEMLLEKNEDLKNSFESYEVLYDKFSEKINSLREDAAKKQEMGQSSTKEKLRKEKIKYKRLLELSIKDAKQRIDDEVNDIYKSPSKWASPDELLNNLILKPLPPSGTDVLSPILAKNSSTNQMYKQFAFPKPVGACRDGGVLPSIL